MSESSFVGPEDFVETLSGRKFECHWYPPSRHDAPTLVFLHEGIGSTAMWKRFPADLAADTGCGTLVYSRHGYGWSSGREAPFAVDYMHREALETLPELLDKREIDNPVLIGHSDGASIAIIHAGGGGRPVRAIVLEAPHVFVEDLTIASIEQAKAAFGETDLKHKLARYHKDPEASFFGWNDIWLHPEFRHWNIEEYPAGGHLPDPGDPGRRRQIRNPRPDRGDRAPSRRPLPKTHPRRLRPLPPPRTARGDPGGDARLHRRAVSLR